MAKEPDFLFNLGGRIRNLSLPASAKNSLIPLFEAVSNSIHAVEARFGDKDAPLQGIIRIDIVRRDDAESHITGFVIKDNGIGLNDENMKSFRTSDSAFKVKRGGKGIGRLSWLKAFTNTLITSHFEQDGQKHRR
jgi:hypothetical protein